ncbi:alpha-(1-_6)-mannopyranosyltransferase A [Corynebacterium sp. ES2730-CONJ]|uniref:alpha-(1->6)-mannopyranosyltransferase A n=1 Tax=Corynebacterium sp. ES2730-CONJ TaxID=2973941 RepID=UPI00216AC8E3|nr:alpha-(1->6)-mannopyranosyltransferase A [Corynebacterium sp. ES2730-CONJ]MCS4531303.1 alpha-(1->6)-mannopyranosyltransferase A [Corynebacterium sp. ES2730-CONJ]
MPASSPFYSHITHLSPARAGLILGSVSALLLTLGSFGGGATQRRDGLLKRLGWEFLSFGHGATLSNTAVWVGTMGLIAAWVLLGLCLPSYPFMRKVMLWWVVPLIPAAPLMSRDVYSYLMQGTLLRDGFDAYTQGPAVNPNNYLFEVSHDWRNTTTPYGPLHLWLSKGITILAGDQVLIGVYLIKAVMLIGCALIAYGVVRLALIFGVDRSFALWIGVLNPVMLIHLIGGLHNEAIMVGLVMVGLVSIYRFPNIGGFYSGIVLIALAMSLKATAGFVLPFVIWIAVNRHNSTAARVRAFFLHATIGALLSVAVLALITTASGASYGWIQALTGNSKVINPLSVPTLISDQIAVIGLLFIEPFPYNEVLAVMRQMGAVIMVGGYLLCWWWGRTKPVAAMAVMYIVVLSFNAVVLPWYYASILPLSAVVVGLRERPLLIRALAACSIFIAASFTGSGNHQLYNPIWVICCALVAVSAARLIRI